MTSIIIINIMSIIIVIIIIIVNAGGSLFYGETSALCYEIIYVWFNNIVKHFFQS